MFEILKPFFITVIQMNMIMKSRMHIYDISYTKNYQGNDNHKVMTIQV